MERSTGRHHADSSAFDPVIGARIGGIAGALTGGLAMVLLGLTGAAGLAALIGGATVGAAAGWGAQRRRRR